MRNWQKYYNDENKEIKRILKKYLNRIPDKFDYKRCEIVKALNTNIIKVLFDGDLIDEFLLIPGPK